MSKITLAGGWLWGWGLWHLVWAVTLLWGGVLMLLGLDAVWVLVAIAGLYTVFVPMEVVGASQDMRRKDGRARTLSEFRQYLPVMMTDGESDTGWRWLGYTGVIDAMIVAGLIWTTLEPLIGATWAGLVAGAMSSLMALWLVAHFGWRHR